MVRAERPTEGPGVFLRVTHDEARLWFYCVARGNSSVERTGVSKSGGSGFECGLCEPGEVAYPLLSVINGTMEPTIPTSQSYCDG